ATPSPWCSSTSPPTTAAKNCWWAASGPTVIPCPPSSAPASTAPTVSWKAGCGGAPPGEQAPSRRRMPSRRKAPAWPLPRPTTTMPSEPPSSPPPPPPPPVRFARARVEAVLESRGPWQVLAVRRDGTGDGPARQEQAFHDTALWGALSPGDQVVLNVTAAELELGTGGFHFVAWVPGREGILAQAPFPGRRAGHIMKLRYTPLQRRVMAAEEPDHPFSAFLADRTGLDGMPVVIGGLHSQVAPAVAGLRLVLGNRAPIVYVMTDAGALPAGFSRVVHRLRAQGRLDAVITAGHAYGRDYEAVNPLSALLAARRALGAAAAPALPGPGIVGTGHPLPTTAVKQAAWIDGTAAAQGRPVLALRVGFRDERSRHRGVSHHTLTVLSLAARPCLLPLPRLQPHEEAVLWSAL